MSKRVKVRSDAVAETGLPWPTVLAWAASGTPADADGARARARADAARAARTMRASFRGTGPILRRRRTGRDDRSPSRAPLRKRLPHEREVGAHVLERTRRLAHHRRARGADHRAERVGIDRPMAEVRVTIGAGARRVARGGGVDEVHP